MAQKSEGLVEVVGVESATSGSSVRVLLTVASEPAWLFEIRVSRAGIPATFSVLPARGFRPNVGRSQLRRARGVSLEVEVPDDSVAVTARLLRRLPIGQMQGAAIDVWRKQSQHMRSSLTKARKRDGRPLSASLIGDLEGWERAIGERPGRRGRQDREYAQIAALYVLELGSGTEVRDLAGKLGYSPSQVRNMLNEARRRGLLTSAPDGRAGGRLTEKAEKLLNKET